MDTPLTALFTTAHPVPIVDISKLPDIVPILVSSARADALLGESLSIIIATCHHLQLQHKDSKYELSPEIIMSLSVTLAPLASSHQDPFMRLATFRALSLLLALSPPLLRLEIIRELLADAEFPQMMVAAVGLAKEAVIDGLSLKPGSPNLLASPHMLQLLGPTLLRPSPSDLFESDLSEADFCESTEPKRLVECLSFYLVLLKLDDRNRVGLFPHFPSTVMIVCTRL